MCVSPHPENSTAVLTLVQRRITARAKALHGAHMRWRDIYDRPISMIFEVLTSEQWRLERTRLEADIRAELCGQPVFESTRLTRDKLCEALANDLTRLICAKG